MKTICIYHEDCTDGTSAAAVVLKKYPDAHLFPLGHNFEVHELEPIVSLASQGDRILTVDCVIGVPEFLKAGFEVTSLDHHIGIQTEMEQLAQTNKKFTFVFDNNKSGATLVWSYLFPKEQVPELLKYVADADIWTWKYGDETKYTGRFIVGFQNKPEEMLALFDAPIAPILHNGKIISDYADNLVKEAVEKTEPLYLMIGSHRVPFYNITVLKSESANKLSLIRKEPVAMFSIDGSKVKISFRSIDGQKPQALELAKTIGGNGHKNAAGAMLLLPDFIKAIVP